MAIATPNAESVSHDVEMRILMEGGSSLPMPCTMGYTVNDPFAVSATFRSPDGSVTWVFSRELLIAGLRGPAGEGDIRISPVHAAGRTLLRIELASPDGRATMEGPVAGVQRFVDATLNLLPLGFEWQYLNFDTGLAQLLNGEAA